MPPSVFPTGVTIYLPDKAHNNYVIFDTKDGFTRLIDMNGNQVKFWSRVLWWQWPLQHLHR